MTRSDRPAAVRARCEWAASDPLLATYHDSEWGVPLHDDRKHFEFLVLDSAQAGLSWLTVLRKREGYRKAFDGFDPRRVARYDARKVRALLKDPGIIRNRMKVESAVSNAKEFLRVKQEFGSFDRFIWRFVDGRPIANRWKTMREIPARSQESDAMSEALRGRGFRFVGSTICYAYMQAAGLVNDHVVTCPRYRRLGEDRDGRAVRGDKS